VTCVIRFRSGLVLVALQFESIAGRSLAGRQDALHG
jgi:hypothetical protein